jgi:hypothetical protein
MAHEASSQTMIARRVSQRLHQIFDEVLEIERNLYRDDAEKERRFLTQSYMALALMGRTTTTKEGAAAAITDGYADDGIDCIYADKQTRRLFLGQSGSQILERALNSPTSLVFAMV